MCNFNFCQWENEYSNVQMVGPSPYPFENILILVYLPPSPGHIYGIIGVFVELFWKFKGSCIVLKTRFFSFLRRITVGCFKMADIINFHFKPKLPRKQFKLDHRTDNCFQIVLPILLISVGITSFFVCSKLFIGCWRNTKSIYFHKIYITHFTDNTTPSSSHREFHNHLKIYDFWISYTCKIEWNYCKLIITNKTLSLLKYGGFDMIWTWSVMNKRFRSTR